MTVNFTVRLSKTPLKCVELKKKFYLIMVYTDIYINNMEIKKNVPLTLSRVIIDIG